MKIDLRTVRLGYGAYSKDFSTPGDRRRFCAWAGQRRVAYRMADINEPYDVVHLTYRSDLPGWLRRKQREGDNLKVVFELIDSFLETPISAITALKRRLTGQDSSLLLDQNAGLREMIAIADCVVCSTQEQRARMLSMNPNVHVSLDIFEGDIDVRKTSHQRNGPLKVVWEGMCHTLSNLNVIRDVLNDLASDIELHVVTDLQDMKLLLRHGTWDARKLISGIKCQTVFHPWDRATFSSHVTNCDVAIIPIDTADRLMNGKPENKLILLWQMGMPVLVSATPAYVRAMRAAGSEEAVCGDAEAWHARLSELIADDGQRLSVLAQRGAGAAAAVYSAEACRQRFDEAYRSIGFEV